MTKQFIGIRGLQIFCNVIFDLQGHVGSSCQKGSYITLIIGSRAPKYGNNWQQIIAYESYRVRNLKFATYLKFATCGNTNKINELW